MKTLSEFLKEYDDDGSFTFSKINYRQGARITGSMGLEEGYTIQPDKTLVFDTVRIHTGVDRSGVYDKNGSRIRNVVYSPFNFNRSNSILYGPGISYGYLVQLFNDSYGFEMRIAHMNPNSDIVPEVKLILDQKGPIAQNLFLGQAGNFGISGGVHTHTEFLSIGNTCDAFDELLRTKYGPDVDTKDYSDTDIYMAYYNKALWIGKTLNEMKDHFNSLKAAKKITLLNKYKFIYEDPSSGLIRTRYSSEYLFNGL